MANSALGQPLPISNIPPDPLGILQVSGFYGPGNWSGWFFLILTSTISVIQHPNSKKMHDILPHLLATNWAAIDLFRQISSFKQLGQAADSKAERIKLHGSIAAALIITAWGSVAALVQFVLAATFANQWKVTKPLPLRGTILLLSTLLPSIALSYFLIFDMATGDEYSGIIKDLPAFYWKGMATSTHLCAFYGICGLGIFAGVYLIFTGVMVILVMSSRHFSADPAIMTFDFHLPFVCSLVIWPITSMFAIWRVLCEFPSLHWCLRIIFAVSPFVAISIWPSLSPKYWSKIRKPYLLYTATLLSVFGTLVVDVIIFISYLFSIVLSGGNKWKDTCFLMPCAPQKIGESDQAFGLMVGLVIFVMEVRPYFGLCVKRVIKRWQDRRTVGVWPREGEIGMWSRSNRPGGGGRWSVVT